MVRHHIAALGNQRTSSPEWVEDLAYRIEQRLPRQVVFTPETAALLPGILRFFARHDRLGTFMLEAQDLTRPSARVEFLASGRCLEALRAGYGLVAASRPDSLVVLKHGIRVVERTHMERSVMGLEK